MAITLRSTKGNVLTHVELDGNFTDLDTRVVDLENTLTNFNPTDLTVENLTVTGTGTVTLTSSSILAMSATDQINIVDTPLKFANMTTTQRNAITAEPGMVIFNTTTTALECYNGTAWVAL